MVKIKGKSRRGGATIFICIILSALILSQCILLRGAILRHEEVEVLRSLHLQAENVLSAYNKSLYGYYGVYCFDNSALNTDVFFACCRAIGADADLPYGLETLNSHNLEKIISDYMNLRFPAMIGNDLLNRLSVDVKTVTNSQIVKKAGTGNPGVLKSFLDDYMSSTDKWTEIFENTENFVHMIDFANKLEDFKKFITDLKNTTIRLGTLKLQGTETSSIQLNIYDPDSIEKLMDLLSFSIDPLAPDFFSYLYINKYASSLFDSNLTVIKEGGFTQNETNIYGMPFIDINGANYADIEFLLTGASKETSVDIVKTLIFTSRTVINLASILLDNEKLGIAEGIACVISACIGLLSSGTVVIEPEVIKYLVVAVWAIQEGISDLNTLTDGGTVTLFTHSSINNQDLFQKIIQTSYRDYIEFFLLFVPREKILNRMIEIFSRYTDGNLYIAVCAKSKHRGREYEYEECYDAYKF